MVMYTYTGTLNIQINEKHVAVKVKMLLKI